MLYFAYGSNLWREQMDRRCPGNVVAGSGRISGWRWIITTRGYASLVASEEDYVLGTVYELSDENVCALDRFEGVERDDYHKVMMIVDVEGQELNCLVYIDPVVACGEPKEEYISRINNGIRDAGLPDGYVTCYLRPYVPEHEHSELTIVLCLPT